ncbi:MAG: hypothetical protein V7K25_21150 [Nostoc sp.]
MVAFRSSVGIALVDFHSTSVLPQNSDACGGKLRSSSVQLFL